MDAYTEQTLISLKKQWHVERARLEFDDASPTYRGGYGTVSRALLHPPNKQCGLLLSEVSVNPMSGTPKSDRPTSPFSWWKRGRKPSSPDGSNSNRQRLCSENSPGHSYVAVKKLVDIDRLELPRLTRMFVREVGVWSRISHPFVLGFLGFHLEMEKSSPEAWLISPWEPLGNVAQYLAGREVSWLNLLGLLRDTVDALAYLHSRSPPICHGDIKSGNVLMAANKRPVLCDFGLSRIVDDDGFQSLQASSSGIKGSFRWAAPELFDGTRRDERSDMWAWGWFAWEVATGKLPFPDERTELAIIGAVCRRRFPKYDEETVFIRLPAFRHLLLQCWAESPNSRPLAADVPQTLSTIIEDQNLSDFTVLHGQRTAREPWINRDRPSASIPNLTEEILFSRPGRPDATGMYTNVFVGHLRNSGTKVAVKVLSGRGLRFDDDILRNPSSYNPRYEATTIVNFLEDKVQSWRSITSARIGPCLGMASVNGIPAIVSPWYENGTLNTWLKTFPGTDRYCLIEDIGVAIQSLHTRRKPIVLHHLTLSNLFVDNEGHAVLADSFAGSAVTHVIDWTTSYSPRISTVAYSPPEEFEGASRTPASDVYSFGCVMFAILSDCEPFHWIGNNVAKLISAKFRERGCHQSRNTYWNIAPDDVSWDIIDDCMRVDPEERPTIGAVLERVINRRANSPAI